MYLLVVIADQDVPLAAGHGPGACVHAAAGVDLLAVCGDGPNYVRAGVDRVVQQPGTRSKSAAPAALAGPPAGNLRAANAATTPNADPDA